MSFKLSFQSEAVRIEDRDPPLNKLLRAPHKWKPLREESTGKIPRPHRQSAQF